MTWLSQLFTGLVRPFKWWVVVAPWERGVRVRMGRTAVLLTPGPHWRIPFLDRVYVQGIRLRTICETNQTMGTRDGRVAVVSIAVRFVVTDMLALYSSVSNPEVTLAALAQSTVARIVASSDSNDLTAAKLEQQATEQLEEPRSWGLGEMELLVTGFAYVRTYRLVTNDYRTGAGMHDLSGDQSGER